MPLMQADQGTQNYCYDANRPGIVFLIYKMTLSHANYFLIDIY